MIHYLGHVEIFDASGEVIIETPAALSASEQRSGPGTWRGVIGTNLVGNLQFSGGMQQRAMIAMGLLNEPRVLVADEPTTALDVTIQAQILALLRRLADERGLSVILVTHNLGVVASICDRVFVMYAGSIVEEGPVGQVLSAPAHPYTKALLGSLPDGAVGSRLPAIPGTPPSMTSLPAGCRFEPRCSYAVARCVTLPPLFEYPGGRRSRCWVVEGAGGVLPSVKGESR